MFWKRCSTCKKEIGFGALHYVCSVSTCNRKGTDFVFCSTDCWDAHVPTFRHRDAWAEERRAPSAGSAAPAPAPETRPAASPPRPAPSPSIPQASAALPRASATGPRQEERGAVFVDPAQPPPERPAAVLHDRGRIPREVLVVASKLKAYIRARSEMNTSDGVLDVLSERLRDLCDAAIEHAAAAGRKTVMDRDF